MARDLCLFLSEIAHRSLAFGDKIERVLFNINTEGKVHAIAQDPYGNLLITMTSKLEIPELKNPGCLHRLGHLKAILDATATAKNGVKVEVATRVGANQKTTILEKITFITGRTRAEYAARDPFRDKQGVSVNEIATSDWPTQFEIDEEAMQGFDEAHKIHIASGAGSKSDLLVLRMQDQEVTVHFGEAEAVKSDPKTITVLSRTVKGSDSPVKLILPAPTLRATLRSLGPHGGIAKLSNKAVSVQSDGLHTVYTITLTGQTNVE